MCLLYSSVRVQAGNGRKKCHCDLLWALQDSLSDSPSIPSLCFSSYNAPQSQTAICIYGWRILKTLYLKFLEFYTTSICLVIQTFKKRKSYYLWGVLSAELWSVQWSSQAVVIAIFELLFVAYIERRGSVPLFLQSLLCCCYCWGETL